MIAVAWAVLLAGIVWVGMWAFGVKALDSGMVGLFVFIVPATAWWLAKPWVERRLLRRG